MRKLALIIAVVGIFWCIVSNKIETAQKEARYLKDLNEWKAEKKTSDSLFALLPKRDLIASPYSKLELDSIADYKKALIGDGNSTEARVAIWRYIKHYLKDPDGADMERFAPVLNNKGQWTGEVYVTATNGFGGRVRNTFFMTVDHTGGGKYKLINKIIL